VLLLQGFSLSQTSLHLSVDESLKIIKEMVAKMKDDLISIYPEFKKSLLWDMPMAWS